MCTLTLLLLHLPANADTKAPSSPTAHESMIRHMHRVCWGRSNVVPSDRPTVSTNRFYRRSSRHAIAAFRIARTPEEHHAHGLPKGRIDACLKALAEV